MNIYPAMSAKSTYRNWKLL